MTGISHDQMHDTGLVQFNCTGTTVGKMRTELAVEMVCPFRETFQLASDEGPFHGGDASAPSPFALFAPPQLEIPCLLGNPGLTEARDAASGDGAGKSG